MKDQKNVVMMEENDYGTRRKPKSGSPWRRPKGAEFVPGPVEQMEEYRCKIIDTSVSIKQNIERALGNYYYY